MAAALDPGEEHTEFISWAEEHGVTINGVAPARFSNRGMGIVAARDIKKGERLVHVHNTTLVHVAIPSIHALKLPPQATVHGKLAAALAIWYSDPAHTLYTLWQRVWPTRSDFYLTMPYHWSPVLQSHLPEAARQLLATQRANLEKDWEMLHPHLDSTNTRIDKSLFTYTWLIVNTRTFYWPYPDLPNAHPRLPHKKRRTHLASEDCYAMLPFMDYFNHSSTPGCRAQHDAGGYAAFAERDHVAGEEVYVSYGDAHSNDFLLAEYGFVLADNSADCVPLDALLVPLLDARQAEALREDRFLGDYKLFAGSNSPSVCRRTLALLRLLVLGQQRYAAFVAGEDDDERDNPKLYGFLVGVLTQFSREVMRVLDEVEATEVGAGEQGVNETHKEVLLMRWKQIRMLVNIAIEVLGNGAA